MTREELKKIAKRYAHDELKDNHGDVEDIVASAFIEGAKWADAHPDIDVRTMAAWRGGYKEAIEKACEWIEEFMQMTPSKKTFIKRFKQAMKGE